MNLKKTATILFLAVIAAGVVTVAGWRLAQPHSYKMATVHTGKAVEAIYATAIVEPVDWAAIAPVTTGRITTVNVKEGDLVKKGGVLAKLDDTTVQAELEEARARQTYLEKEMDRVEKLLEKGHASQQKYDEIKSDLEQIQAHIRMHEQQAYQLSLLAPIDGTVLWRDVELGEVKQAGEPLFWVGKPRPLRLEAEVDEEDIPKVKSGQKALITADAFEGRVLEGVVNWISPKGDPVNKSYRVYVSLPDETPLMIGMTVETNIIVQEKGNTMLVPTDTVIEGPAVWLVVAQGEQMIARKVSVKTGIVGENNIEILSGLAEGDRIILPPFNGLKDGAEIQIK